MRVKDFFKANKVAFADVYVDDDADKAQEMIEKSGQTAVPVIEIDGKIIVGYQEKKLKEMLGL